MPPKHDLNKAGQEDSDFPILCETCLGANPYVRMSKQSLGKECKICTRPFTIFRWLPGAGMRYKKTEICQTCAKLKNVCQTCLLDLQYGLPTQVRDTALGLNSKAPTSNINREYFAQNMENQLEGTSEMINYDRQDAGGKDVLKKLARTDPYYKRNRPHICSFYAKGECARGDGCPYRHELPVENELSKQNIQDRYHGRNDPVARKILSTYANSTGLTPPEDESIVSLFLSSLPPEATNESIIRHFFTSIGIESNKIKSVVVVPTSRCAFINFINRGVAEDAASRCSVRVQISGKEVMVRWGRSKPKKNDGNNQSDVNNQDANATIGEREIASSM
ncbi:uncharacterized protein MELLADRAFT_71106 [Melampsora larici-populina 98AG31]|uniref:Pre-mRNA-splicing factor SLT11 n=1 Tax=Melampsora larici-populina (strain 98AG31 / pathotype 3-4-7) TaxID=747676 RepID=F4RCC8_MELLP|nr:uncharacterized protein MELLADRAFT_71106 [Melampsora larici-populina 98AG31]EGG09982.1 hypothetical protein MELLADRAFT_71106 [Melampsora larici-populina 98AG31]